VLSSDDELRVIEAELKVVSSHLVAGQHEIRVFAPSSPGAGFSAVPSGLEDVYFLNVSRQARN
jgi:ABC-2 type transport system ATP-binding protein